MLIVVHVDYRHFTPAWFAAIMGTLTATLHC